MFHFHSPKKHKKTAGFFVFRGMEVKHWLKMGQYRKNRTSPFHEILKNHKLCLKDYVF